MGCPEKLQIFHHWRYSKAICTLSWAAGFGCLCLSSRGSISLPTSTMLWPVKNLSTTFSSYRVLSIGLVLYRPQRKWNPQCHSQSSHCSNPGYGSTLGHIFTPSIADLTHAGSLFNLLEPCNRGDLSLMAVLQITAASFSTDWDDHRDQGVHKRPFFMKGRREVEYYRE